MVVTIGGFVSPVEVDAATSDIKLQNGGWSASAYLNVGGKQRVRAYTKAEYKTIKSQYANLKWSYVIDNPTIASVAPAASNMSADITALSVGYANLSVLCTGIPKSDALSEDNRVTVLEAWTYIVVYPDVTGLTLAQTSAEGLILANAEMTEIYVDVNFPENVTDDFDYPVSLDVDNKDMYLAVGYSRYDKKLRLDVYTPGEANLNIYFGNVKCPLHILVKQQGLSDRTKLLAKGKSSKISMLNYDGAYTFSSLQPKVVSCTEDGEIKALAQGNAVIVCDLDNGAKLGCVVSVVPSKIIKVCKKAIEIGATCEYSQAKRMTAGYYDCSSLTYLAYKSQGYKLCGVNGWAPTSRDQAKWCKRNGRFIKGSMSDKNVQKMKFLPGDLMFEYTVKGNLDSMYHVEMIVGYVVNGFDYSGKPILGIDYANRRPNYYAHGANQYVGRPVLDM